MPFEISKLNPDWYISYPDNFAFKRHFSRGLMYYLHASEEANIKQFLQYMYISVRLTCIASLSPKVWGPPNKIWGTDLIRNMSVHVLLIWLTFTSTPNTYRDLRHRRILYSQCSSDVTVTTSSMGCWKMSASRHAGASFNQADQVEGEDRGDCRHFLHHFWDLGHHWLHDLPNIAYW